MSNSEIFNDRNDAYPFWRPTNQLPYPATAGMLLVTKSDFTLPARPDLLEWKTTESIIGVSDVNLVFNEDKTAATIYKTINNEVIEVGTITMIPTEDDVRKLMKIDYITYYLKADAENHTLSLFGVDKNDKINEISKVDYISYKEYVDDRTNILEHIASLDSRVTSNKTEIDNLIKDFQNLLIDFDTFKSQVESEQNEQNEKIAQNTNNIKTNEQTINNNRIDFDTFKKETNEWTSDVDENYKPVINILREATNPNLVLCKGSDGVSILWKNVLGIDDITADVDNEKHTITFYKLMNNVKTKIIELDKFEYSMYTSLKQKLDLIDNDLNEQAVKHYVPMKNDDGRTWDWKTLNDFIKTEIVDSEKEMILDGVSFKELTFTIFDEKLTLLINDATELDNYIKNQVDDLNNKFIELILEMEKVKEQSTEAIEKVENKQNKLIAGDNITLTDNEDETTTISAKGGSDIIGSDYIKVSDTTVEGQKKIEQNNIFAINYNNYEIVKDTGELMPLFTFTANNLSNAIPSFYFFDKTFDEKIPQNGLFQIQFTLEVRNGVGTYRGNKIIDIFKNPTGIISDISAVESGILNIYKPLVYYQFKTINNKLNLKLYYCLDSEANQTLTAMCDYRYIIYKPNNSTTCSLIEDGKINLKNEVVPYIHQYFKLNLNAMYPVNALYFNNNVEMINLLQTSYDQTWEEITDTYKGQYLVIGDDVTTEELPLPDLHTEPDGYHEHSGTTSTNGAHTHTVNGSKSTGYYIPQGSYYGKDETTTQTTSSNGDHTHTFTTNASGSHTHTITAEEDSVYKENGHIKPLGLGLRVWKRIS